MADYFNEMGWTPLSEGQTPNHFLLMARFLRDSSVFDELNVGTTAPPASRSAVEALPTEKITSEGSKCPICLKEHPKGESVKKLPCGHLYHKDCILPWLSKTNSCPVCRHELPTDDEDYEAWKKEQKRAKEREADIEHLHNSMFS
nr:E3 ubiquitin-protein ligase RNF181-like [Leptinotarsa decemlineata]